MSPSLHFSAAVVNLGIRREGVALRQGSLPARAGLARRRPTLGLWPPSYGGGSTVTVTVSVTVSVKTSVMVRTSVTV